MKNIKNDLQLFKKIIVESKSIREVFRKYGIKSKSSSYFEIFHKLVQENNINIEHFTSYKKIKIPPNLDWSEIYSLKDLAVKLKLIKCEDAMSSTLYAKLKAYITDNSIDTSHFNCNGRYKNSNKRYKEENIFKKDSEVSKQTLKVRYLSLRSNNLKCDCPSCDVTSEWLGKQIVLHLDHIDGNSTNNSLDNLRLLCPNCHSQTSTYSGRNIKK